MVAPGGPTVGAPTATTKLVVVAYTRGPTCHRVYLAVQQVGLMVEP